MWVRETKLITISKNYHFWLKIDYRYENLRTNYIADRICSFLEKLGLQKQK